MSAMLTAQEFSELLDETITTLHRCARSATGEVARNFSEQREAVMIAEELWEGYSTSRGQWLEECNLPAAYSRMETIIQRNFKQSEKGEQEGYALVLRHLNLVERKT